MKKIYFILFIAVFTTNFCLSQTWEQKASYTGIGKHHPAMFGIGNYGYLVSGGMNSPTDDFYRYDATGDSWETMPNFPGTARGFAVGLSIGGKGYVGFGQDAADEELNDLWEYDPVEDQWTELASLPGSGRTHPAFIAFNGKIYVGLGEYYDPQNAPFYFDLDDWWEYDIAQNSWTQKATFPGGTRHHPYYFAANGFGYVGMGHSIAQSSIYKDLYKYDLSQDQWTQVSDIPSYGRVAGTCFSLYNKGYLVAGQNQTHGFPSNAQFWEYDAVQDSWLQLSDWPAGPRWAPGSFLIDGTVYASSGADASYDVHSDLWSYDLVPVSVEEKEENDVAIFPNPTSGMVNLKFRNTEKNTAALRSIDGKVLNSFTFSGSTSIDLSTYSKGIYLLEVNGVSEKLVVY